MRVVTEPEFRQALEQKIEEMGDLLNAIDYVVGPGRSGAIAAVYVSHMLGVPFVPFGRPQAEMGRVLIVDTARESGATMQKAMRRYESVDPIEIVVFEEPPRVAFWYEAPKPQRYRRRLAA